MSKTKLKDILQGKEDGEEWYSIQAPEEIRFWKGKRAWKQDMVESFDIIPSAFTVKHIESNELETGQRFTQKNPIWLDCGVVIRAGYTSTVITDTKSFTIPFDSTAEFNVAMREISARFEADSWEIVKTLVYSNGALLEHKIHNPDSNGSSLYLYRATIDGDSRLYPDIPYGTQELLVGKYRGNFAHCVCNEGLLKFHGCAVKKRASKKAQKQKLSGKWMQLK